MYNASKAKKLHCYVITTQVPFYAIVSHWILLFPHLTPVFNRSITEPSPDRGYQHVCYVSIKKTKKIWRPKWEIICKRNLPRCLFMTKEWNGSCSMKASDMAYRNGRRLKMVGKMFSKHHWSLSFVYTWENIDFFVAIWVIIRHLVRCGIVEAALSSKLASQTPLDSRAVPMLENGCWNWQRAKGERKGSENRSKWKTGSIRWEKGHTTNLLTTCLDVNETRAKRNQNCSKGG